MASIGDYYGFSQAPTNTNPYPDNTGGTGVVPLTVEPLNGIEQNGLMGLAGGLNGGGNLSQASALLQQMNANPQAFAQQYTNPLATQYLQQGGQATASALNPITQQQVENTANPFSSALKNRLNQQGEIARAQLLQNQGVRGARSFGDTAQGVRQGMLDTELLSKSNDIDYNTYNDARAQLENERNRSLQAGGQYGGLATNAQGVTSNALSAGQNGLTDTFNAGLKLNDANRQNFSDQLGAGNYIRTYDQGVANLTGQDMLAQAGDPSAKLAQAIQLLQGFNSSTSTGQGTNGTGVLSNVGNVISGIAGFL